MISLLELIGWKYGFAQKHGYENVQKNPANQLPYRVDLLFAE